MDKEYKQKMKVIEAEEKKRSKTRSKSVGSKSSVQKYDHGDEKENEIEENLDEISKVLGDLKVMGNDMNEELESQSTKIKKIQTTTEHTEAKMKRIDRKLNKFV